MEEMAISPASSSYAIATAHGNFHGHDTPTYLSRQPITRSRLPHKLELVCVMDWARESCYR